MNKEYYEEASKYIPGGVNSPVRAFHSVGIPPVTVKKGLGKYLYSEEGLRYTDYCLSWGPLILGHAYPPVQEAIRRALVHGSTFGAPTLVETELAHKIVDLVPSIQKVRFVSSGTEAVMSAIRLARAFTGRDMVLKFDGCYHGHSDGLLVSAGSGLSEMSRASSAGIPADVIRHTLSIPYNDLDALKEAFNQYHDKIACVIVEPVAGNMGVVLPQAGFLEELRLWTSKYGSLLIFDEVITGFRLAPGGAQQYFGITPDLTILGKIIGGGLPVGAFGGRQEIMDQLAPLGNVYQAGTLSGNPLAMHAGLATLEALETNPHWYGDMADKVGDFARMWTQETGFTVNHIGSMFTLFYCRTTVSDFHDAGSQDQALFRSFYRTLLDHDIYMPPSMYESAFISIEHDASDLEQIVRVARDSGLFK